MNKNSRLAQTQICLIGADVRHVVVFSKCSEAMSPEYIPVNETPIDLSIRNLDLNDNEAGYYGLKVNNLRRQFAAKIKGALEVESINHLSVFALAPIPLLMELGRLLSEISPVETYQLHREPAAWCWDQHGNRLNLRTDTHEDIDGPVALKLERSSNISDERVKSVLGDGGRIRSVSAENPHNDAMRNRDDLGQFRTAVRDVLSCIKDSHGEDKVPNIFPAIPVSASIEFGRIWMSKADLPLKIYDQSCRDNGFIPRLEFGEIAQ